MNTARFELLGQRLREDLARHLPSETENAELRRHLLSAVALRASSPTPVRRRLASAALAAALLVAVWLCWPGRGVPTPLSFWVEDRAGQIDDWVTARGSEQSLRFSDGSSVVAAPSTTARVTKITADGARLTLERGQLDAHVVHREASSWLVVAGPFAVKVTGTRFRVTWEPQTEMFFVRVSEGRVEVTGGGYPAHDLTAGSELALHAGGMPTLEAAPASSPSAEPPFMPDSATGNESEGDDDEPHEARPAAKRERGWRELSKDGQYGEAFAAIERLGFSAQCSALGARDLLTLGSTAELARHADRAGEAFVAVRRRFPRRSEAHLAAFFLGRLASNAGQTGQAIGWFQSYLADEPSGPLAREAAGRLIELARRAGNGSEARAAADRYLKAYPNGPHAALARSVLSGR